MPHKQINFYIAAFLLCSGTPLQAEEQKDKVPDELDEIVVTAPSQQSDESPVQPVMVLRDEELRMKTGHSIGETLKNELGINSQSFGPGVGTPVIRGQAGPRVRVLSNGIGSNDVSAFSPGLYLLEIVTEGRTEHIRFVKR